MISNIHELLTKPGVVPRIKDIKVIENADCDKEYNYDNPNDSLYCPETHNDDDHDGFGDFGEGNDDLPDVQTQQGNFLGDNLVDAPEMVSQAIVPYALQAKRMDMKKLKAAVWQCITEPGSLLQDVENQRKVKSTTFSNMYETLPLRISASMQKELSCPMAFVALLHLCNEQDLHLTQITPEDFQIDKSTAST